MIVASQLLKSYGRSNVLTGLSLEAQPGAVTLLIGANGAGKTTTMRILSGLIRSNSGDALISGRSIRRERIAAQSMLSFLPQGVDFHPRLTCLHVLRFYARLRGCSEARIAEVLELAGLEAHAEKPAGVLSGGLRQRLGVAVFLLPDAPVLLLDEPGLSLDPIWRSRLQAMLREEAARGKTVLVTTHLLGEWEGVADRCLLCSDGRAGREVDPAKLRSCFETQPVNERNLLCAT